MKKKIFSFLLCLLMCVTVLTGCNLSDTDLESYYSAVVASIHFSYSVERTNTDYDYTVEITKRDLINSYNSYGYYYVEYYSYTTQEAIEETLNTMINREFIKAEVSRYCEENGLDLITEAEATYLWNETYDSIYENLRDYYLEVIGVSEDDEEDEDEDSTLYTEYTPSAYYTYDASTGKYTIKRYTASSYSAGTTVEYYNGVAYNYELDEFKDLIYEKIIGTFSNYSDSTSSKKSAWETAFVKYMNAVRSNYPYEDLDDNKTCFYFEMDRIYEICKSNFLIEKYEEIYNLVDSDGSVFTNVSASSIVDTYVSNVLTDYNTYYGDSDTFNTDMLSSDTKVNYIYNNGTTYFNLGVIKIDLNTEKYGDLDAIEEDYDNQKIDYDDYLKRVQSLYNTTITVRDEYGEETGEELTASELLSLIQNATKNGTYLDYDELIQDDAWLSEYFGETVTSTDLTDAQIDEVYDYIVKYNIEVGYKKADAFVQFLYQYNDNYENVSSDKTSVFGVDGSGNVYYSDDFSDSECDALSDAIIALYNNGNAKVGDISEIIEADDGIYILFYAGTQENLYAVDSDFHLTTSDIQTLGYIRVDIFSKETYFDSIYDELYADSSFDSYDSSRMSALKNSLTSDPSTDVKKYVSYYSDLY